MTKDDFILGHRLSLYHGPNLSITYQKPADNLGCPGPTTTNGLKGLPPMEFMDWLKEKDLNQ